MDTELLVDQKDAGRQLIQELDYEGFPVDVAFWVQRSEEGHWQLYLASPIVDEKHPNEAYRRVYAALSPTKSMWVSPSDVTLLHSANPLAVAAAEIRDRRPSPTVITYPGRKLGNLPINCAVIYPELASPRRAFTVTYYRKGDTNHWTATTKPGAVYRLRAKGAVSYSSARREGERREDERIANVSVLVEIDPRFADLEAMEDADMRSLLAQQARRMADEMFLRYHPGATIEHDEEDD
jgi:hypothetical protein